VIAKGVFGLSVTDPLQMVPMENTLFDPGASFPTKLKQISNFLYRRYTDSDLPSCGDDILEMKMDREGSLPHELSHLGQSDFGTAPCEPQIIEERPDLEDGTDEEEALGMQCLVCMEHPPDTVLIECGHGGLCAACAGRLWREGPARRRCPLCRQCFAGVLQIVRLGADGSVRAPAPACLRSGMERVGGREACQVVWVWVCGACRSCRGLRLQKMILSLKS
jgi:hypothetical protein